MDRPDYLHFDLDPVPGADFEQVRETALLVREALDALGMRNFAKTTGSKGIHVYVPIVRGPTQKQVWAFAKGSRRRWRRATEARDRRVRGREAPRGRVLVDYNQNAWGRTLASVYSVRPQPRATVSTPVTWKEVERGIAIEEFRMDNVPARVEEVATSGSRCFTERGRFRLETSL